MKKLAALFLMIFTLSMVAQKTSARIYLTGLENFVGTWKYTVKVPSQYNRKGSLTITKEDAKPSVKFVTENGNEIEVEKAVFEDDQLKISFKYNYDSYTMKLKKNGANKLTGVVLTPQGQELDVTADKTEKDS